MATVAKREKGRRRRRRRGKDRDEAMENLLQEVNSWMADWVARHEALLGFYRQSRSRTKDEDRSRTKGLDPKDMEHDETNNHEFKSARGPKGLPYGELITGTRDFIEEGKR
ncbi:hypothetical protein GW17_00059004 [Ensete ventricosum]|nr:hypothetical protein GW17_00059004 [Ensete ventricosum]RZS04553.1 hypothetical protein BHM03_00034917 [Ensete ventricosum]